MFDTYLFSVCRKLYIYTIRIWDELLATAIARSTLFLGSIDIKSLSTVLFCPRDRQERRKNRAHQ